MLQAYVWALPFIAAAATYATLCWLLSRADRLPMDHPNHRSLHEHPIPRIGGVGLFAGALPALFIVAPPAVSLSALGLALLSHLDDRSDLPIATRFGAHAIAALVLAWFLPDLSFAMKAIVFMICLWSVNLYNFMDGSDGLAGGMALIGFGAYACAALVHHNIDMVVACAAVASCAASFLRFNFPPARLFMGDTGSVPLGFLAAALGALGTVEGLWPFWFPLLVFSAFWVDASITLTRRMLRGEKFWKPHRMHYYQRLVQMGWGHRKTALAEYVLMLGCAAAALALLAAPSEARAPALLAIAAVYATLAFAVDRRWRQQHRKPDATL